MVICSWLHSSTPTSIRLWQHMLSIDRRSSLQTQELHTTSLTRGIMDLKPLSGPFNIQQVQGKIGVTHSGTVILEVDSQHGKTALRLTNVLFIESMQFNILSLQQLRAADFIPVFNEVANKVVVKKILQHGGVEQVALLSRSKAGRLTLD